MRIVTFRSSRLRKSSKLSVVKRLKWPFIRWETSGWAIPMVVTCGYALEERSAGAPADFHIAPETKDAFIHKDQRAPLPLSLFSVLPTPSSASMQSALRLVGQRVPPVGARTLDLRAHETQRPPDQRLGPKRRSLSQHSTFSLRLPFAGQCDPCLPVGRGSRAHLPHSLLTSS